LPPEVENLLQIIAIKGWCREAGIERVEAGPKGAVIALRGNSFKNPQGLVDLIQRNPGSLKIRPDQKIVYLRNWDSDKARLAGVTRLLQALVRIAAAAPEGAAALPPPVLELAAPADRASPAGKR
jgi:transcription-repair coupling factor (superfamily II helicase)